MSNTINDVDLTKEIKPENIVTDTSPIKMKIGLKEVEVIPLSYNYQKKFIRKVIELLKQLEPQEEKSNKKEDTSKIEHQISSLVKRIHHVYQEILKADIMDVLPDLILILSEYYELGYSKEDLVNLRGYGIPAMVQNIKTQLEVDRDSAKVAQDFFSEFKPSIPNWEQIMVMLTLLIQLKSGIPTAGYMNTPSSSDLQNDTTLTPEE
jgi:hypothetical protein